ncbi:MAG: 3-hydroxyacyl-CoA dehydrogenase/enoyl-CoA hydratase family protein [Desulfobacteraceae bacterium]|nr:MAG: 3-hydroxyacyl-CoA dehydrogenase/enoyl-CoA hydratase family protein [Desulfobacteraceae bacterium]
MAKRIEKVAVIGSGIMGSGIAALCAGAGIPTLLLDIVPFDLKDEEKDNPAARNRIVKAGMDAALKAKPPVFYNKKTDLNLIATGNLTDDFQKLAECDLIFEVVVENLKIKQDLFARIEKVMKKGAVIASNTSGLPLYKMAEGRSEEFKKHFMILHFFNPVRYMKMLEIVPGKDTLPEITEFIANWGEKILGKGMVWAKDTPNFIGNRIGMNLICKTFKMIENSDIIMPEVDALFGPNMGMPRTAVFALADLVGLDTIVHVADGSYENLPDDEARDVYQLPQYVRKMMEKKMLGKKTKDAGGFYKTEIDAATWAKKKLYLDPKSFAFKEFDRKAVVPAIADAAKKGKDLAEKQRILVYGDDKYAKFAWELISNLLVYSANRIPEISDNIIGIDNAMRWGFAWEVGPFEIWDNIGLETSVKKMEAGGMKIPAKIKAMLAGGNKTFYKVENGKDMYFDFASNSYKEIKYSPKMIFLKTLRAANKVVKANESASLIDLGDGVYNIEFHSKMNALNKAMLDFMEEAADYVFKNGVGMVIGNQAPGMPGAFSAGGDLAYMGGLAKEGKFSEIDTFIKGVHRGIMGIKYSNIPVVAAPYGLTLGGGCEVCLACDKIVAHTDLIMGLVEIGAGLVPGGCGMMHLWQRYMDSVPGSVNLVDYGAYVLPAFMAVAQAKTSMSASQARDMGFLRPTDRIIANKDYLIGEAKKEVLKMVDDGYAPPAKKKYPVMGQAAQGMVWAEMFNMKSGGFIPPHMEFIAKKAIYCMSGGEARQGQLVSEEYLMKLEREAFVELWRTENTQKMANHIMTTGKPLML